MKRISTSYLPSHLLFAFIVTGVYITAVTVAGLLPGRPRAGALALGMTLDMIIVVPAAFYFLVVRRRGLPAVAVLPVIVVSFAAASLILPADHQQSLRLLETIVAPIEIGFIGWIAWRAVRAMRAMRREGAADPLDVIYDAAFTLVRNRRMAMIVTSELAVLYYAIVAWRARPHVPHGVAGFTHHKRSAHGAVVAAALLVIAAEGIATHFIVADWSPLVAWVLSAGSAYAALWIVADYRATVLRPILVGEHGIDLRAGLRWTLRIPRDQVLAVDRRKPVPEKESLALTFLGTPTHWLRLAEPAIARGPYGLQHRVRAIGIQPDAPAEFNRALGVSPA